MLEGLRLCGHMCTMLGAGLCAGYSSNEGRDDFTIIEKAPTET